MKDVTHSQRIKVQNLDAKAIKNISSDLARMLAEAAANDPEVNGKFHLKIGHIKGEFSREGHFKIVIGGGGDDETEDQGS